MGFIGIRAPDGFGFDWRANGMHITPINDIFEHHTVGCGCQPFLNVHGDVPFHTHNRFDGADIVAAVERGETVTAQRTDHRPPPHKGYPG